MPLLRDIFSSLSFHLLIYTAKSNVIIFILDFVSKFKAGGTVALSS